MKPKAIDPVDVAAAEIIGMSDVFNRLTSKCYQKCISPTVADHGMHEPMTGTAEASCTDRCTKKYLAVHQLVGFHLQEAASGY